MKIADSTCSATTIRVRRDPWVAAGVFEQLEQLCLEAYDKIVGLELSNLCVDGCLAKVPCGGGVAGRSPVDRGKLGTKRSVMTDAFGIPIGCVVAAAKRHDSPPLLCPTLEKLGRFALCFGLGLPEVVTAHLDAGYDSAKTRELLEELGCRSVISVKGFPLQAGARWVVERTNSWHTRGFKKLQVCTERCARVIDALIALAKPSSSPAGSSAPPGQHTAGTPDRPTDRDLSAEPLSLNPPMGWPAGLKFAFGSVRASWA